MLEHNRKVDKAAVVSHLTASPLEAIKHICHIRQSVFGFDYLKELIERFSTFYGLTYAFVGRPSTDGSGFIKTDVLLANGERQDNITYGLSGSPCEKVMNGENLCLHEDQVCDLYPRDDLLVQMEVRSYLGSRLMSPEGKLLGILVFMSTRPMALGDSIYPVLDFIASRAGMELEREELNERRRLKAQEESRDKRLASLGQLVNGVAHDFNNLLAGILGHAELLELKLGDSEVAKPHIEGVLSTVMRATNLTSQLMDFSNPQANLNVVTDVSCVIDEIEHLVMMRARDKNIKLRKDVGESLCVKIDGSHLQQILLNLVLNAIDSISDEGEVSVSARRRNVDEESSIELCVCDTGAGITEHDQEHIFDPFFTTKQVGKGSGLGLASVYSIVQTYGGSVSVNSTLGSGSQFRVLLPNADADAAGSLKVDTQTSRQRFSGIRVLFAEDDDAIARSVSELMRRKGFAVTLAKDGVEAKKLLNQQAAEDLAFDLVVADLKMPKLKGDELYRYTQQNHPGIKFILSTGDPSEFGTSEAFDQDDSGALLVKPYGFASLLEVAEELLLSR